MRNVASIIPRETSPDAQILPTNGTKVRLADGTELGGIMRVELIAETNDIWRAKIECLIKPALLPGVHITMKQAGKPLTWWRRLLLLLAGVARLDIDAFDREHEIWKRNRTTELSPAEKEMLARLADDQARMLKDNETDNVMRLADEIAEIALAKGEDWRDVVAGMGIDIALLNKSMDVSTLLDERMKYEAIWQNPEYRHANHGLRLWRTHRDIFPAHPRSALDIGCGNGVLFAIWNEEGIEGHGVDFAQHALDTDHPSRDAFTLQCLWQMRFERTFELGVCADVMEHIPPQHVTEVLACIAKACDFVVFNIANYPSDFGTGELHLTQRPADWWLAQLSEHGEAAQLPDLSRPAVDEYVFTFKPSRCK